MRQKKGDPEQARQVNTSLILDALRDQDNLSRAELSRMLSISKMTTSAIVSDLIDRGLLIETHSDQNTSSAGGRPPILLSLDSSHKLVVGIDIGTTNTALVVGNLKGQVLSRKRIPTNEDRDPLAIANQVTDLVEYVLSGSGISRERVLGVGVSVAGLVEKSSGHVKFSPDFKWRNVHFREMLEESLCLPVVINNCTRLAALGELRYGAAQGVRNVFYVNVGYGIGSAIVTEGRIYEHNSEFGHIHVTSRAVRCQCGKTGCLEAVSSGHAIERAANGWEAAIGTEDWITAKELADRGRAGDRRSLELFEEAGKYLGRAISTVANLLNPELVIIGGGVSYAGSILTDPLLSEFDAHTMDGIKENTQIEVSELGLDAGVIGAMALALDTFVFQRSAIDVMV